MFARWNLWKTKEPNGFPQEHTEQWPSWQTHMGPVYGTHIEIYMGPYGLPTCDPYGFCKRDWYGIHMGIWYLIWDPYWSHVDPTWDTYGFCKRDWYGSHMGPTCIPEAKHIYGTNMGPTWVPDYMPIWDQYGSHKIIAIYMGFANGVGLICVFDIGPIYGSHIKYTLWGQCQSSFLNPWRCQSACTSKAGSLQYNFSRVRFLWWQVNIISNFQHVLHKCLAPHIVKSILLYTETHYLIMWNKETLLLWDDPWETLPYWQDKKMFGNKFSLWFRITIDIVNIA